MDIKHKIGEIRKLFSEKKFDEVLEDLSKVKQDLNDSNRKRAKSQKDKSK